MEITYTVMGVNGRESPPIPQSQLYHYVRAGTIKPQTMIRDNSDGAGRWFPARDHPACAVLFRQNGIPVKSAAAAPQLAPTAAPPTPGHSARQKSWVQDDTGLAGILLLVLGAIMAGVAYWSQAFGEYTNDTLSSLVFLSGLVGMYAHRKGISRVGAIGMSLVASPILGFLWVAAQAPDEAVIEARKLQAGKFKRCPRCAELIKTEATICRHCQTELTN
jgi:hypothetical protein